MIHPVILCGGTGTRLWPVSRKAYPKQFVPLVGETSLYQHTLLRHSGAGYAAPTILTGDEFRFQAVEQAAAIGLADPRVVVEPAGRDTGPAVLTAALTFADRPDSLLLIVPSDHVIRDPDAFHSAVEAGRPAAEAGKAVTFGVVPDRPETGFGYLETRKGDGPTLDVVRFREKPDEATAREMLDAGGFLWNAGIFLFRAGTLIEAFQTHAPDLVAPCRAALDGAREDLGFLRLDAESYGSARAISFDYAVMEKTPGVVAVPLDAGWSDLGAWDALWSSGEADGAGNALTGPVTALDCTGSYLRSDDASTRLVGLGLDGMIAVATRDAVLVAPMDRAQDVKRAVEALRAEGVAQADANPRFHRPWGWYETLCIDARFQVKRIMVKPGGVLSLQSHMHRSEHWIVVAGTAEVTIGDETRLVTENESVYIPLGARHRMANHGKLPMYLIEVQTGAYLGEDDILRYEDIYNRA